MFQHVKIIIYKILELLFIPVFLLIYIVIIGLKKTGKQSKLPRLIWGVDPIINNKYWSECLKGKGFFRIFA